MSVAIWIVIAALGLGQETWTAALESGDYQAAWELAEREPRAIEGHVAKAEILYRAGDPLGAWQAAAAGLRLAPERLELLYRAAGAALWLEQERAAQEYSERLEQAVRATGPSLSATERADWENAAREFVELSRALILDNRERERALARARLLSIGGLACALGLIAWSAGRGYGRSSKPVS